MRNKEPEKGIAHSVVLGLKAVSHSFKSGTDRKSGAPDGILFSVCDQPKLKISTIQRILNDAALHKKTLFVRDIGDKKEIRFCGRLTVLRNY